MSVDRAASDAENAQLKDEHKHFKDELEQSKAATLAAVEQGEELKLIVSNLEKETNLLHKAVMITSIC